MLSLCPLPSPGPEARARRRTGTDVKQSERSAGARRKIAVAELPAGTVTFLFTDIEGSTRLWEAYPEVLHAVVARHDAMAASVIPAHEGVLVKSRGEGDSLFAVFARASDALAAALALQRALLAEEWP